MTPGIDHPVAPRSRTLKVLFVVLMAVLAIPVAIGVLVLGMGEARR